MASLEVDLTKVAMGQTITVKWRGKPVFIRRRSEEEIESARQVDLSSLRDPQTDEERVQNPEVSLLRLSEQLCARSDRLAGAPCAVRAFAARVAVLLLLGAAVYLAAALAPSKLASVSFMCV